MQFKPLTQKEYSELGLLSPGIYRFEVIKSEEATSQKNNPMIKITLKVNHEGKDRLVFDNIMEAFQKKLYQFAHNVGLSDKYELGTITASDCLHKVGYCEIIKRDAQGPYDAKNEVKSYLPKPSQSEIPVEQFTNDEVPF